MKKWATGRMRENYEDFERLLAAKNAEIRALISSQESGKGAQAQAAGVDQSELQRVLDWMEFHEPKINLLQ